MHAGSVVPHGGASRWSHGTHELVCDQHPMIRRDRRPRAEHDTRRRAVQTHGRGTDRRGKVRPAAVRPDQEPAALVDGGRDAQGLAARERRWRVCHARLNGCQHRTIVRPADEQHRVSAFDQAIGHAGPAVHGPALERRAGAGLDGDDALAVERMPRPEVLRGGAGVVAHTKARVADLCCRGHAERLQRQPRQLQRGCRGVLAGHGSPRMGQERRRLGRIGADPNRYARHQRQQRAPPVVWTKHHGHVVAFAAKPGGLAHEQRVWREQIRVRVAGEARKGEDAQAIDRRTTARHLSAPGSDQVAQVSAWADSRAAAPRRAR